MSMPADEAGLGDSATGDAAESARRADEVATRIERRRRHLRDEQIERALTALDERGTLTPEKRVVVAALADRISQRLVAAPIDRLRSASERDADETVETALELFG